MEKSLQRFDDLEELQQKADQELKLQVQSLKRLIERGEKSSSNLTEKTLKEMNLTIRNIEANIDERINELSLETQKISKLNEEFETIDLTVVDLNERFKKIESDIEKFQENLLKQNDDLENSDYEPPSPQPGTTQYQSNKNMPSRTKEQRMKDKQAIYLEDSKTRELKNQVKQVLLEQKPITKEDLLIQSIQKIEQKKKIIGFLIQKSEEIIQKEQKIETGQELQKTQNQSPQPSLVINQIEQPVEQKNLVENSIDFDYLPSEVEQIIENHIRIIDGHLIYLEQLRPKFKQFEIGNEMNQLFSHVEVQTFQQQKLLEQADDREAKILELTTIVEELQSGFKRHHQRLQSIDQGRAIDLTALQEAGGSTLLHSALLQILSDIKTELFEQCQTKDHYQQLESRVIELEDAINGETLPQKEELEQIITQMKTFPSMMSALQLQIMRIDTNCFDIARQTSHLEQKLQQFGQLESEILAAKLSLNKLSQNEENEKVFEKNQTEMYMKIIAQLNVPSKEQIDQMRVEFDQNQTLIHHIHQEVKRSSQKSSDQTKQIRAIEKRFYQLEKFSDKQKIILEKVNRQIVSKVDMEDFDEEIRQITKILSSMDSKASASLSANKQPKRAAVIGGGLSKADKQQLADIVQSSEKLGTQIRLLQTQFRQLGIEDIKNQLKYLPEKANKSQLQEIYVQLQKDLNTIKHSSEQQQKDLIISLNRQESRITRVLEQQVEKGDESAILKSQMKQVEEQIQAMKRKNAVSSLQKQMQYQPKEQEPLEQQPQIQQVMLEDDVQLNQRFVKLHTTFSGKLENLEEKLKKLILTNGGEEKQKKMSELKRIDETVFTLQRDYKNEIPLLQKQINELQKKFDEKIRRQGLVNQTKIRRMSEEDELMGELKQRPRFVAQHITRDLVLNGRLPHLESYGDHLARYGRGFSQMLSLAGELNQNSVRQPRIIAPQLMQGVSLGQLSLSDAEMPQIDQSRLEINESLDEALKTRNRFSTLQQSADSQFLPGKLSKSINGLINFKK